jgi:hypothetical protein
MTILPVERSAIEVTMKLMSIFQQQLIDQGYNKIMPYCGQELLEMTLRAFEHWSEPCGDLTLEEACEKTVKEHNEAEKKICQSLGREQRRLPKGYAKMLMDILAMLYFLTPSTFHGPNKLIAVEAIKKELRDRV